MAMWERLSLGRSDNNTHIHTQHEGALCLWPTRWCGFRDEQQGIMGDRKNSKSEHQGEQSENSRLQGGGDAGDGVRRHRSRGGFRQHAQADHGVEGRWTPSETRWTGDRHHSQRGGGGKGEEICQEREKPIGDAIIINGLPSLFFFFLLNIS